MNTESPRDLRTQILSRNGFQLETEVSDNHLAGMADESESEGILPRGRVVWEGPGAMTYV